MDEKPAQTSDLAPDEDRRRLITWLWRMPVLAALGGAGYAAYELYQHQFSRGRASDTPFFEPSAPEVVTDLETLGDLWSAAEFVYAGVPAIALHLPEPIAGGLSVDGKHYAAFSRICTHQGCIVNLNDNEEALATLYNYRSAQPALACNCHFSVFLPLRGGETVSGPALEPLPRVQLEAREGVLYAVGLETT